MERGAAKQTPGLVGRLVDGAIAVAVGIASVLVVIMIASDANPINAGCDGGRVSDVVTSACIGLSTPVCPNVQCKQGDGTEGKCWRDSNQ